MVKRGTDVQVQGGSYNINEKSKVLLYKVRMLKEFGYYWIKENLRL